MIAIQWGIGHWKTPGSSCSFGASDASGAAGWVLGVAEAEEGGRIDLLL